MWLKVLVTRCHGRGREFESRRPRHSFQRTCTDFEETKEGATGHVSAPFLHPFSSIRVPFSRQAVPQRSYTCVCLEATAFVSEEKTSASTAACAAWFAGEIACVYTFNVDRNEECRNSS